MKQRTLMERYRFGWRYHLLVNAIALVGFITFWYTTIRVAHPGHRNDIWVSLALGAVVFYVNFLWVWPLAVVKNRLRWLRIVAIGAANLVVIVAFPIALSVMLGGLAIDLEDVKPADLLSLVDGSILNLFPYLMPQLLVLVISMVAFLVEWIFPPFANKDEHEQETNRLRMAWRRAQLDPHLLDTHLVMLSVITRESQEKTQRAFELTTSVIQFYIGGNDPHAPILLEDEVMCLRNLMEIQRLRYGRRLNWHLEIEGDLAGILITPMVLMPLAENMIRYATLNHAHISAVIRVKAVEGNLYVSTENHIRIGNRRSGNGTGLTNLNERLSFVYPEQYSLSTRAEGGRFYVELEIAGIAEAESEL